MTTSATFSDHARDCVDITDLIKIDGQRENGLERPHGRSISFFKVQEISTVRLHHLPDRTARK